MKICLNTLTCQDTLVTCDLLFVYLHRCAPHPPGYLHQTVETVRETASGPVLRWALDQQGSNSDLVVNQSTSSI